MADVPGVVQYGKVVGYFTAAGADSADASTVPDEVKLTGFIYLTPNLTTIRFAGTSPARVMDIQPVRARVYNGKMYAPDADPEGVSPDPEGVWLIASDQPDGSPNKVQWTARFLLDGVGKQLPDVVFEVPGSAGTVDLSQVMSVEPEVGIIKIVSNEDREAAENAAQTAVTLAAQMPHWWSGSQASYNAIPTKDPNTLYVITS